MMGPTGSKLVKDDTEADAIWVSATPLGPPIQIQIPHFKVSTPEHKLEPTEWAEFLESGEDPTGDADPEEAEDASYPEEQQNHHSHGS